MLGLPAIQERCEEDPEPVLLTQFVEMVEEMWEWIVLQAEGPDLSEEGFWGCRPHR